MSGVDSNESKFESSNVEVDCSDENPAGNTPLCVDSRVSVHFLTIVLFATYFGVTHILSPSGTEIVTVTSGVLLLIIDGDILTVAFFVRTTAKIESALALAAAAVPPGTMASRAPSYAAF